MTFRPYPLLTIACGLMLAALVWLGLWQLQRADWKRDLIADFSRRADLPSVSWEVGVCPFLEGVSGGDAPPVDSDEIVARAGLGAQPVDGFRVFGRSVSGVVGWRIFQSLDSTSCGSDAGRVLVQTGFEAEIIGDLPPAPEVTDFRYSVVPWPEHPGMAGANAPEDNQWYWLDGDRMALVSGDAALNRNVVVEPFAGMPSYLTRTPPVRHISYAVTWFGLAICLLFVYVLLHRRAGRLTITKQNKPEA